jgi:UDP-2,3-diacylglucosamine pyrophosphatase LpxH
MKTEVLDKRDKFQKVVDNGDGTQTVSLFISPVHYQDEKGDWQDIDPSIIENTKSLPKIYDYVTKANEFSVGFKRLANENQFIRFTNQRGQGGAVSITLTGLYLYDSGSKFLIASPTAAAGVVYGNTINYPGVFPGVDLEFISLETELKENITLHSDFKKTLPDPISLKYDPTTTRIAIGVKFESNNGTRKTERLAFLDATGQETIWVGAVQANDFNEKPLETFDQYSDTGDYLYGISYKDSQEAAYPIIIDPTIYTTSTTSGYLGSNIGTGTKYVYGGGSNPFRAGSDGTNYYRSYYRFDLSTYTGVTIGTGTFSVYPTAAGSQTIALYQISDWLTLDTVDWAATVVRMVGNYGSTINQYVAKDVRADVAMKLGSWVAFYQKWVSEASGFNTAMLMHGSTAANKPKLDFTTYPTLTQNTATAGDTQVTVNWTNSGGLISGDKHRVYYMAGTGLSAATVKGNNTYVETSDYADTSKIITGLVNGTNYCFIVVDVMMAAGNICMGTTSNVIECTPHTPTTPVSFSADTVRSLQATYTVKGDTVRQLSGTNTFKADTLRKLRKAVPTLKADTFRKVQRQETVKGDTLRKLRRTVNFLADTIRKLRRNVTLQADSLRVVRRIETIKGDTFRKVFRSEAIKGDTFRKVCRVETVKGDTVRKLQITYTVKADTVRNLRVNLTLAADTVRKLRKNITFAGDTIRNLRKNITFQGDTLRSLRVSLTLAVDTYRKLTRTVTFAIDTLRVVICSNIVIFKVDTLRKIIRSENVQADTFRKVQREDTIKADTLRKLTRVETVRADTLRRLQRNVAVAVDTLRKVLRAETLAVDTVRRLQSNVALVVDTYRKIVRVETVKADTLRKLQRTVTFAADTLRVITTTVFTSVYFAVDSLRKLQTTNTFKADTVRKLRVSAVFKADAYRKIIRGLTFKADTLRKLLIRTVFKADTVRKLRAVITFKADTLRRLRTRATFLADTYRKNIRVETVKVDTLRSLRKSLTFAADTLRRLMTTGSIIFAVDTLRRVIVTATPKADTVRGVQVTTLVNADTVRRLGISLTFAADTLRKTRIRFQGLFDTLRAVIKSIRKHSPDYNVSEIDDRYEVSEIADRFEVSEINDHYTATEMDDGFAAAELEFNYIFVEDGIEMKSFTLGESKEVGIEFSSTDGTNFEVASATYTYKGSDGTTYSSGGVTVDGKKVFVLLTPEVAGYSQVVKFTVSLQPLNNEGLPDLTKNVEVIKALVVVNVT